jgi:hypothetical protein
VSDDLLSALRTRARLAGRPTASAVVSEVSGELLLGTLVSS